MTEETKFHFHELRRRRQEQNHSQDHHGNGYHSGPSAQRRPRRTRGGWDPAGDEVFEPAAAPFNVWLLTEMLLRRWFWVVLAGAACGGFAFLVGLKITSYTAKVSLIRNENPNAFTAGNGENAAPQAYISRELSAQTLFGLMRSPDVFRRASEKADPPASPEQLSRAVKVIPERNPDFVTLALSGKQPKEVLAKWANVCADQVVEYTKQIQADEAGSISEYLKKQVRRVEGDLVGVNNQMIQFADQAQVTRGSERSTEWPERFIPQRPGPRPTTASLLLCAVFVLSVLTGCRGPFARTGPKFDARKPKASSVTNLVTVELTNRVVEEWLQPVAEPFTLGPGDKIEVEILSDPSTRTLLSVGPDGRIYFYLLNGLDVWGLTLPQTKEMLEREVSTYVTGAQVAVTLRGIESKRIWLLGRLHSSGVYPVGGPITLLESISAAGGLLSATGPGGSGEDLADLQHSFVVRQGQLLPVDFDRLIRQGDMTQNIYLRPDDFVYVPSAQSDDIYVLGAVHMPKPVAATATGTLVSVIANVGGTIKDAYLSQVGIVRGSMAQPKIAVVSYKDIVAGKAPDVRLQARDIVYVPFSPYKNLIKYADLITATFVRAVAINEGARAVEPTSAPVGVNIGISNTR